MARGQALGLIIVALILGFIVGFKSGQKSALDKHKESFTAAPMPPEALQQAKDSPMRTQSAEQEAAAPAERSVTESSSAQKASAALPRLVELGSTTCMACKEMKPILEALQQELKGKLIVEIIDIYEHPEAADKYQIQLIPTQIFFDAQGKEIYRHEGFMPKEEILAQLQKMGVPVK